MKSIFEKKIRYNILKIYACTFFILFIFCNLSIAENGTSKNLKNTEAVQRVLSKKETTANAAWWGFDPKDSTKAIQGAINSGATKVIVPYVGKEWIVEPIKLVSNQEIVFEPGVVIAAKKGAFQGENDCLFSAIEAVNITLRGYGASLKMRKKDYKGYKIKSEHRHVIQFLACTDINILGLKMASSGGDGIYIGPDRKHLKPSKNILIRDCVCDDNYRQGISITSVDTLKMENCILSNTQGTPPGAGLDIEPNDASDVIRNIVISNCVSKNNSGSGFIVSIGRLKERSHEVSILFVDCYVKSCVAPGVRFRSASKYSDTDPKGLVEFKNCIVEDISYSGAYAVWEKAKSPLTLRFSDCKWYNVARRSQVAPIFLILEGRKVPNETGGIEFSNCYLYDKKNRPFLRVDTVKSSQDPYDIDIRGDINVFNGYGAKINLGTRKKKLALKVNSYVLDE